MAKKEKQKKQYDAKKHIQMTGSDRVMNGGFYLFITVFSIICLIPFLLVLGSSFTAERHRMVTISGRLSFRWMRTSLYSSVAISRRHTL